MKKKFKLEDYLYGDYVIHCPEEWQATIFYKFMAQRDYRLPTFNAWNKYKENTCYNLRYTSEYSPKEWYHSVGYTILEFDDFDWSDIDDCPTVAERTELPRDAVNHPAYYTDGKIEVIDFIEDKKLGFSKGNAVKYICRAGKKDPNKEIEDLEKAIWYIQREIKMLGGAE